MSENETHATGPVPDPFDAGTVPGPPQQPQQPPSNRTPELGTVDAGSQPDQVPAADSQPTRTEVAGTAPAGTEATGTHAAGPEAAGAQATGTAPAGTEATGAQATGTAPAGTEATAYQPGYAQPEAGPSYGGPVYGPPAAGPPEPPAGYPENAGPYAGQTAGPGQAYGAPAGPPWSYNATAGPGAGRAPSTGRLRRGALLGVLALALAGGGGVVGGLIVHEADSNQPVASSSASSTNSGRSTAAAPVIDRSSLADIVARVQPSVVSVRTSDGEGSGVVLSADGYVLTNNHVVASNQGNAQITVAFTDGRSAKATVVGTDAKSDLAVIKANGLSGLTAAKLGDSAGMRVGDSVFAIGSPLGLDGSVTSGIISATDRTIQESGDQQQSPFGGSSGSAANSIAGLLQTDAAINPGNSGGALVNLNGEIIGINTAIATSGQGSGNIGVGFAIPSNRAKTVSDQLIKGQKVSHPYLGVGVNDAQNDSGALVSQVTSGGPADKAGIKTGDVITKLGDKAIRSGDDLVSAVQSHAVGDKVSVTVSRNGSSQTVQVTIGES